MTKQTILFAASEGLPYIKTGGLADVIGSLPKELVKQGAEVVVVMPLYKKMALRDHGRFSYVTTFPVDAGDIHTLANIYTEKLDGVTFYFVEHRDFFERDNLYGYHDDAYRFGFFQHAVLRLIEELEIYPDVVHSHDWHTGAIPFLTRVFYHYNPRLQAMKHVFTIHNLAFQGVFDKQELWSSLGITMDYFNNGVAKFYDNAISFMKLGILYANKVTTVSQTYASEILTDEFGENMHGILQSRYNDLVGIVNGIDYDTWDTQKDTSITSPYSVDTIEDKVKNKLDLQKEFNLPQSKETLLVGIVSRLTWQKGFYLIIEKLEQMLQATVQFVVLGNGEGFIEHSFEYFKTAYPNQVAFYKGYNEDLAHRIYAGSDLFLMPSMFEPCGISQLIAMRYGSLPLVRETGGLKDTVTPYHIGTKEGTGFSFSGKSADSMMHVFNWALETYYTRQEDWAQLVQQAMTLDVSWYSSAKQYLELYDNL